MAPEQLEGQTADARTDIFALGMSLYEMATGRKAFTGESQASLIASILTGQPPSIASTRNAARATARSSRSTMSLTDAWRKTRSGAGKQRATSSWSSNGLPRAIPGRLCRSRRCAASSLARALAWTVATVAVAAACRRPHACCARSRSSRRASSSRSRRNDDRRRGESDTNRHLTRRPTSGDGGVDRSEAADLDPIARFGDGEPVPGTDGAVSPFWSPDSRFLGFFSPGDGALKKVEVAGGPARTICPAQTDGGADLGT